MLVSFQRVEAQNKKEKLDGIYYKSDTSNVPVTLPFFRTDLGDENSNVGLIPKNIKI